MWNFLNFFLFVTNDENWMKNNNNKSVLLWLKLLYGFVSAGVINKLISYVELLKKTGILYNCVFSLHQLQSTLCFKWDELKTIYWLFCLFLHFPSFFSAESFVSTLFFHVFHLTSIHLSSNSKSWMHLRWGIDKWRRLIETFILNIKVIHCVDSYNDSFISKDFTTKILKIAIAQDSDFSNHLKSKENLLKWKQMFFLPFFGLYMLLFISRLLCCTIMAL